MWVVVQAINWAAVGLTIPIVWANWRWRGVFPLNGRATPLSVLSLTILVCCYFLQGLTYTIEIPCYWHYFLHFAGIPMVYWCIMIRGARLLWQFELTNDLSLLEQRRTAPPAAAIAPPARASIAGSAPSAATSVAGARYVVRGNNEPNEPAAVTGGIMGWKASWYTNHHYLIKPALIIKMTVVFCMAQMALWLILSFTLGGDRNRCGFPETKQYSNVGTWVTIAFVAVAMVPVALLGWKLRPHSQDGFGIRKEFSFLVFGVTIPIIASLIVMAFGRTEAVRSRGLDLCIFWGMSVSVFSNGIWPLVLAHRHDQLQRGKQTQLARAEKLDQLLAIPEGFHAFLLFCGSEFCSESLLFYQRVIEYRTLAPANALATLTHTLPPSPLIGATTAAIPDSPAVARTPNTSGPRVLANSTGATYTDRQPLLTVDTGSGANASTLTTPTHTDNGNNATTPSAGNNTTVLSPTDSSPILALMRTANGGNNGQGTSSTPLAATSSMSPQPRASRQSLPRHTPSPIAPLPSSSSTPALPPSSPHVTLSPRPLGLHPATTATAATGSAPTNTPTATPKLAPHASATGTAMTIDPADVPAWMIAMLQEAIRIYETYNAPGSPFEINVGAHVRTKIEQQLLRIKNALNYHTGDTPRSLSRSRTASTVSGGHNKEGSRGSNDPILAKDGNNNGGSRHLHVPGTSSNVAPPQPLPPPSQLTLPASSQQGTPALLSNGNGAPVSGVSSSSLFPPSPSIAPSASPEHGSAALNASNAVINVAPASGHSPGLNGQAGPTTARSIMVLGGGMTLIEVYHELRTIFDAAQTTSYALMEANSWNRFRTSAFFQQFLSSFQGWTTGAVRKRSGAFRSGSGDDDEDDRSTTGGGNGNRWQMGQVAQVASRGHGQPAAGASRVGGTAVVSPGGGTSGGHSPNNASSPPHRDIRNSVGAAQALAAFTSGVGGVAAATRIQQVVQAQSVVTGGGHHSSHGSGGSGGSGGHGTRAGGGGHTHGTGTHHHHNNNHTHGSVLSSGGPVFSDAGFNPPTGTFVTTSTSTPTHHGGHGTGGNTDGGRTSIATLTSVPSSSPPTSGSNTRRVVPINGTTTIAMAPLSSPPVPRSGIVLHASSDTL